MLAPRPVTRLSTLRARRRAAAPVHGRKPVGFSLDESIDRVTATLVNIGLVARLRADRGRCSATGRPASTTRTSRRTTAAPAAAAAAAPTRGCSPTWPTAPTCATACASAASTSPPTPGSSARCTTPPTTACASSTSRPCRAPLAPAFDEAVAGARRWPGARTRSSAAAGSTTRRCTSPPDDALAHVEARSANLAQPRPEYGHCTNAICIVGRRELTRGLHLDRRAFLVSYDPTIDTTYGVLERILAAVGPVGAGISLEYYFSSVDNEVYGCGTKLPHNVTGLIGVMNGHQSDLRTGLPLQMVEIHEPMRLLLIVDATPEALLAVAGRQAEVAELVVNAWVQLVSVRSGDRRDGGVRGRRLRALRAGAGRRCPRSSGRGSGTCARASS